MLSAHLIGYKWCNRLVITLGSRHAHHDANQSQIIKEPKLPPDQSGNPNLIQKIILRFNGIPLKGESGPPKAFLENLGKKLYCDPLPPVPKDFKEFPERDIVNYPYPEFPMYPPKTRFVLIPDHWLREIEKVTGTSGPYLTIFTSVAFLLNKEFLPWDENLIWLVYAFIPIYFIFRYGFGYKADKYAYGLWKAAIQEKKDYIQSELKEVNEFRKISKQQSESLKAVQENFPIIFRENLALQLESAYRQNVDYAWSELKRRLDYMKEVQETKERFGKEILLKAITEGVRKKIETNEGGIRDKYMDQCIDQLKTVAQ